jgi:hypothetical protein
LKSRLTFWTLFNTFVREQNALPPIKIFKHSPQSIHSKTKGGVDGSAQAWAILRAFTSALKWEQTIVTQTFQALPVNEFLGWRMARKKGCLSSAETFGSIDNYRHELNRVQSFADLVDDVSQELLEHSELLDKQSDADVGVRQSELELSGSEKTRLVELAGMKKRNRIVWFNSADGVSLRLRVRGHEQRLQKVDQYCGLCRTNKEVWRGRRTTFK